MKQIWHDLKWSDNFVLYTMIAGILVGGLVAISLLVLVQVVLGESLHPIVWQAVVLILALLGQWAGGHIGLKLYLE